MYKHFSCVHRMIDFCFLYAAKWRFQFNADKSFVMQFSLNKNHVYFTFPWNIVDLVDNYCHFGFELNSKFKSNERTNSACRNGTNSYFAFSGAMSKETHPSVLLKLYKTVVLPSVLYGSEIWPNLNRHFFSLP